MNNETSPLTLVPRKAYLNEQGQSVDAGPMPSADPEEEQAEPTPEEQAQNAWNGLMNHPLIQAMREANQPAPHEHGPFTWLLNANHNAIRGCTTCGQTWTGLMSGVVESDLRWHVVAEPPEEA
jgi:hypothetical protein